ncbi:hypothetical protein, partial [Planktothrix sp.]|uniref:hypothetical protein n=1 Tax=Planktothrix sp. TaxID=3088171 RepID=UPI0038D4856F
DLQEKKKTFISRPKITQNLGISSPKTTDLAATEPETENIQPPLFQSPVEQKIAQLTYQEIQKLESRPEEVPTTSYLNSATVQAKVKEAVTQEYQPEQLEIEGVIEPPNIQAIVEKTTNLIIEKTINIPKILVIPKGVVRS